MALSAIALHAAHAALLGMLYALVNAEVVAPYMDEPFHLRQTESYCAGRWSDWEPKLTTFPGLFLLGGLGARLVGVERACTLGALRALNLLPALATPYLLHALLRRLHPALSRTDLLGNAAVLALVPTHFFYHFLYYTDTASTCAAFLLLFLGLPECSLARGRAARRGDGLARRAAGALAAAAALAVRQTNAVWIAYVVGADALATLEADAARHATPAARPKTRRSAGASGAPGAGRRDRAWPAQLIGPALRLLRALGRTWRTLCARHAAPVLLLLLFGGFVVSNGSVVLGDRSNHSFTPHFAQLLYLIAFACAPYHLHALTIGLPTTLRDTAAAASAAPRTTLACVVAAFFCAHCTYSHPFLLADNRHVSFHLWRRLLSRHVAIGGVHLAARYALVPLYLLCARLLYGPILARHTPLRAAGLLACCALVLVPSPLLELRYLTLPAIILRLHSPPLVGAKGWGPPLAAFAAVDCAMLGVFLWRPYTWADGSVARLMW